MKLTGLLKLSAFASIIMLQACRTSSESPESAFSAERMDLEALLDPLPEEDSLGTGGNYGKVVPLKDVLPCIELYKTEMAKHGFTMKQEPADLRILQTQMITLEENFRGHELLEFLIAAARKRGRLSGRKNTTVKIVLGMYTQDYLAKHAPTDSDMRQKKQNRIAVFLITATRRENGMFTFDDDDDSVFDFGGLQP